MTVQEDNMPGGYDAELERKKMAMIREICASTARGRLRKALAPGDGSTFYVSANQDSILVVFTYAWTGKMKKFHIRYERFDSDVKRIRTWYERKGPGSWLGHNEVLETGKRSGLSGVLGPEVHLNGKVFGVGHQYFPRYITVPGADDAE